jgi:hypothetical protein
MVLLPEKVLRRTRADDCSVTIRPAPETTHDLGALHEA